MNSEFQKKVNRFLISNSKINKNKLVNFDDELNEEFDEEVNFHLKYNQIINDYDLQIKNERKNYLSLKIKYEEKVNNIIKFQDEANNIIKELEEKLDFSNKKLRENFYENLKIKSENKNLKRVLQIEVKNVKDSEYKALQAEIDKNKELEFKLEKIRKVKNSKIIKLEDEIKKIKESEININEQQSFFKIDFKMENIFFPLFIFLTLLIVYLFKKFLKAFFEIKKKKKK
jgi:hypothetical protein